MRSRVAVFAKAPVPGPVEDRLEDFAAKGVDVMRDRARAAGAVCARTADNGVVRDAQRDRLMRLFPG